MARNLRSALLALVAELAFTGSAQAAGGDYVFDGGDAESRGQVRAALNASSFEWDLVPVEVTIHIKRGVRPHATPGEIWLDSQLLSSGRFAWGTVQHEYAHQVAFFLVGKAERAKITRALRSAASTTTTTPVNASPRRSRGRTGRRKDNVERDEATRGAAKFRALMTQLVPAAA